jgi:hypothetical protein
LGTLEPFDLTYDYPWSGRRRTRLVLFATNFELQPNDSVANISVELEDVSHRIYPLTVEYVGKVQEIESVNRIVVRLNDDLTDLGDVLVRITYRGVSSEPLLVGIGHVGS